MISLLLNIKKSATPEEAEKEFEQQLNKATQNIDKTTRNIDTQLEKVQKENKELIEQKNRPPKSAKEVEQKLVTVVKKKKTQIKETELTFKEVVDTMQDINGLVNVSFKAAVTFGLKGQDAANFAKVTAISNTVTNIFGTVSSMLVKSGATALITGGLSILSDIGGLLGSLFGKKNEPSPEMQMLQKMYKRMEERFDQVMKGIEHLDNELNEANQKRYEHTIKNIEANRQIMIEGFNRIEARLKAMQLTLNEILRTEDEIISIAKSILFQEINAFETIEADRKRYEKTDGFKSFDDYYNFYDSILDIGTALKALQKAVNSKDSNYVALTFDQIQNQIARYQIRRMYEPACKIFNAFYLKSVFKLITM